MDFHELRNRNWYPYTVATCSAVILAFLLMHLDFLGSFFIFIWRIICPLVAGTIIAYMMDPVARFYEQKVLKKVVKIDLGRKTAVALACITIFGSIFLLFLLLLPYLFQSITVLIENIDGYQAMIISFLKKHGFENEEFIQNIAVLGKKLKDMVPTITKNAWESATQMSGVLVNIGLGCILAIYFLLYKKRIVTWIVKICERVIQKEKYPDFMDFCVRCNTILLKYISCSLLEAVIVGCSNAIFMRLCRMPFVSLISVGVGITNLAPTFGPLIGGALGFIILALVDPGYAILFLLFTFFIQTIDGYVIKPKLFGNSLGVSSLWILIAIICGGKIFGVVGLLLAIPFAAIAQYLLEEILFPKVKEEYDEREH